MPSFTKLSRFLRLRRGEEGFALIAVLLITAVITVLIAVVGQDAIENMSLSHDAEDWNAALGAAQAGVSDFSYRLNSNESYSYCLALKTETNAGTIPSYCSGVTIPPSVAPNWTAIPDNPNNRIACYSYSVPSNGLLSGSSLAGAATSGASAVLLDVTGKITTGPTMASASDAQTACDNAGSGLAVRKIRVTLTRTTYLNYAYFTDRETEDPAQYSSTLSSEFSNVSNAQADANQYCSNYYFALSPGNTVGATPAGGIAPTAVGDVRGPSASVPTGHSSLGSYTNYTASNICTYTKFGGDTFNGPVHTNDTFFLNSATTFNGVVEVSHDAYANQPAYASAAAPTCGVGYPVPTAANNFDEGNLWVDAQQAVQGGSGFGAQNFPSSIVCHAPIQLPTANSTLSQQAAANGCLYEGLTFFYFDPSGAIDVYSPGTPPGTAGTGCPVNGSFTPSTSSNPAFNGDIYVKDQPAGSCTLSTVANPTGSGPLAALGSIIQDNDLSQLENEDLGNTAPYQGNNGVNRNAYDCHNGDAFVGGQLKGQLTLGTDGNVVVYQNLTYPDDTGTTVNPDSSNVLGLEPIGSVQIYHPVSCPGWSTSTINTPGLPAYTSCSSTINANGTTTTDHDINLLPIPASPTSCPAMTACRTNYIQAAILAFNGEFTAENWSYGPSLGTINVTGSVAQRYRGRLAGTINGGYGKSYGYDKRLAYITPPYFLPPGIFSWTASNFSETTSDSSN